MVDGQVRRCEWVGLGCLSLVLMFTASLVAEDVRPLPAAHAHNDYAHRRPLLDALDHGFGSVEADVFLVNGKLLVGHTPFALTSVRSLENLYLKPLHDRVTANGGQVYPGHDRPLILQIDFKSDGEKTYAAIQPLLETYADMLTETVEGKTTDRAVTIVLTGGRPGGTVATQARRLVMLDGRPSDLDGNPPPNLVPVVSENWTAMFKWDGTGEFPTDQRERLTAYVDRAHKQSRQVRFWGAPDNIAVWTVWRDCGVDIFHTDNLDGMRDFLLPPR